MRNSLYQLPGIAKTPYRLSSSRFFDRFTTLAIRVEKESERYRKFNTRKPKTNIREQSVFAALSEHKAFNSAHN